MAYQFIHVETYARAIKEGEKGTTMRKIIAEAGREANNCPHIDPEKLANPELAPTRIYGLNLDRLEVEANAWAEQSKDGGNQKLRKNGMCLLAGVVSLPAGTAEKDWQRFKVDAMKWLKSEYGDRLRSVIEHKDEDHPHFHFYCVAKPGEQFLTLHKGIEARTKARQQKLSVKEQNLAYCEAMREWQDKFSLEVGQKHGLTRLGPGRRRLTRAEWKKEQQQAKALQQARSRAEKVLKQAEKQAKEITQKAQEQAQKTAGFGASVGGFFAGAVGKYHKPTKEAEEAAEKAAEALEAERARNAKAFDDQRKHYEHELAESESARDHLKLTIKEKNATLKNINTKYGDYIKQEEEREKAEREAREAEQRRQQRAQEQEEQRVDERKRHRGSDTKRSLT